MLAGALRILGLGVFRTGGEEYARSNVSVATLQRDHVRLCREQIRFRHVARGGALREGVIADAALAASIFHYGEFTIRETKEVMAARGIPVRL